MKEYQVEGVGIETGRRRRRVYRAKNDQHLVEVAKADGTQIHSYEPVPPPEATEAQRDYAQQLGIELSSDATKSQATDLITNKVEGDPLASMTERRIAESFGVELDPIEDRYIGTRTLRLSVCSRASRSPREHARWLAVRILQDYGPPISEVRSGDFHSARLVDIADQLASDEAFLRSPKKRGQNPFRSTGFSPARAARHLGWILLPRGEKRVLTPFAQLIRGVRVDIHEAKERQ